MATDLQPPRGIHDLIGEDQRRHNHVVDTARRVAATYGFDEWTTPIFEATSVFSRTLGSATAMSELFMVVPDHPSSPAAWNASGRRAGVRPLGHKPIPRPSFLNECEYLGFIYGARRWRTVDGKHLLTWDGLHGEIEAFDTRGRHIAVLDSVTGVRIRGPVRGRWIDV